jgi:hypothetical protein
MYLDIVPGIWRDFHIKISKISQKYPTNIPAISNQDWKGYWKGNLKGDAGRSLQPPVGKIRKVACKIGIEMPDY